MAVRVGVLQCIGKFDDAALRYLLLSANARQDLFEFEFLPLDDTDPFLTELWAAGTMTRAAIREAIPGFRERYEGFLERKAAGYRLRHEKPAGFVVLSVAACRENYIRTHADSVSVITMGDWQKNLAPPSILEFIYAVAVRGAIQISIPQARNHLGTRGCLFDFFSDLSDMRQMVLSGRICGQCKDEIRALGRGDYVDGLEESLNREWLGSRAEPGSPASIIAKLGHDLFLVKDLKPTAREQVRGVLAQEGAKQALAIVGSVLVAALILALGLRPEAAKAPPAAPVPSGYTRSGG